MAYYLLINYNFLTSWAIVMKKALFDSRLQSDCFINKMFSRQIDHSRVIPAESRKIENFLN